MSKTVVRASLLGAMFASALVSLTGCASLEIYHQGLKKAFPYGATRYDMAVVLSHPIEAPMPPEYTAPVAYVLNPVIHVFHIVDIPISLAVDTVMLPFVLISAQPETSPGPARAHGGSSEQRDNKTSGGNVK